MPKPQGGEGAALRGAVRGLPPRTFRPRPPPGSAASPSLHASARAAPLEIRRCLPRFTPQLLSAPGWGGSSPRPAIPPHSLLPASWRQPRRVRCRPRATEALGRGGASPRSPGHSGPWWRRPRGPGSCRPCEERQGRGAAPPPFLMRKYSTEAPLTQR